MCKTYQWTCNACGRSQSRGQRCSARTTANGSSGSNNGTNCPTTNRIDGPPPQAEHNGIRCAYCHTPSSIATNMSQPKTGTQNVNPASLASNTNWESRQSMMPPPSWNTNTSPPRPSLQHQAAPTGYQSPSSGPNATNYIAMSTMPPNAAAQHHHYPSHVGHAQANFPHQRHGGNPGSLPLFSQPHQHAPFNAPSPSGVPIDPQILAPHAQHQHSAPRSHPRGAASAPPFVPPTSAATPSQQHHSPPQARPLQQQTPHGPAPAATGAASATLPHLRSPADVLASMTATRTALFMQAEAQRAATVQKSQSEDEGVDFGNAELQAAWYAMWEGCGVPHATVSAAATAARNEGKKTDEEDDKHGEGGGRREGR